MNLSNHALDLACAAILEGSIITGHDKYGAPIFENGKRSLAFLVEKYRDFPQKWSPSSNWQDAAPILRSLYGADFLERSLMEFIRRNA